jgi:hypothetical protein
VKLWGTVAVAALGVLASTAVQAADVPGYKFTAPVQAKGANEGNSLVQGGDINIKRQFSYNWVMASGGERLFAWDGSKVVMITDESLSVPDGATFNTGNMWSPHGINDNGVVSFTGDMDNSPAGDGVQRYILTFDLNTKQYTIVARPGDEAPGGGVFANGSAASASGRMHTDINNKGQVVFCMGVPASDGTDHSAVFLFDPAATPKLKVIAREGMKTADDKVVNHAWWPDLNENGEVTFGLEVQGDERYGVYLAKEGVISPILAPGTRVGDVRIDQAGFARNNNAGDIVFVGAVGEGKERLGEGTRDNTGVFIYTAADKTVKKIVVEGEDLPGGGNWTGVEPRRRPVGINDKGQVLIVGLRDDDTGGLYLWDATNGLRNLVLTGDNLPGVGTVTGLGRDGSGFDGYNIGINNNGDVMFPAQIDGIGSYVVGEAPAPTAGD